MSEAPCKTLVVVLAFLVCGTRSHVIQWEQSKILQPVQGLYVKPSTDGTTGDLYVAASEDTGANTQWLADQPINFLPNAAATQAAPASITYTSSVTPTTAQKQAVFTSPTLQYSYSPEASVNPYAAAIQSVQTNQVDATTAQYPLDYYSRLQYSLYQYFYPYIMQMAAATAANALKEAGLNDDMVTAILSQTALWSRPAYSYPVVQGVQGVQYVDQNNLNQSQVAAGAAATQPTLPSQQEPATEVPKSS